MKGVFKSKGTISTVLWIIFSKVPPNKKNFESNVHWGVDGENSRGMQCWTHKLFNLTSDFHLYACEWTPDFIKFYFDGILIRTVKDKKILKWFEQPLMVIIGNGISMDKIESAVFPNIHEVDYVKVYSKN